MSLYSSVPWLFTFYKQYIYLLFFIMGLIHNLIPFSYPIFCPLGYSLPVFYTCPFPWGLPVICILFLQVGIIKPVTFNFCTILSKSKDGLTVFMSWSVIVYDYFFTSLSLKPRNDSPPILLRFWNLLLHHCRSFRLLYMLDTGWLR